MDPQGDHRNGIGDPAGGEPFAKISGYDANENGTIEYVDPLDEDLPSDKSITLTDRQLGRLIFIAAETGARFERDGSPVDPLAWLFSLRTLFEGKTALDACQKPKPFIRATILHGLSIGFDAQPNEIDALVAEDRGDGFPAIAGKDQPAYGRVRSVKMSPA